ncbi:MAG TPA: endonuclease/exonuclease/phosphatase family protein [Bacteroidales bacterium]|nr:endonuclease/exonuclease/phosphatase family protein [Bacteroidales bacterium]HRX98229.1 endonuclease/exonuclease/phosphatase family protein [Bacteroidales bacterium]
MAKAFSCLTWNVENFGTNSRDSKGNLKPEFKAKVERVALEIKKHNPDVFALFEVRSKDVFDEFMNHFTGYAFHITEGEQAQETLLGIRSGFSSFVTQRLEFKSGNAMLRPGVLLTLIIDNIHYVMLFVHLKSMNSPVGWGLRDDMFDKIRNLKTAINAASGGPDKANLIVAGDYNTMGMNYTYGDKDISSNEEITRLKKLMSPGNYKMRMLTKNSEYTYFNGSTSGLIGNLDHVLASSHLEFKQFGGFDIKILGLTEFNHPSPEQDQWIKDYSDHGIMFFEVQKVI